MTTKREPKAADRVVLYARISEDTTGEGAGVARQLEDMRALADVRGWEVVDAIDDNDVSAWKGAARPSYQRVMELVVSRSVDRVVVWHMSRLWRSRAERAADQTKFTAAGVSIAAVRGPEIDLTSATGRVVAGILGEFDSYESDVKAERVARAAMQRAHQGRANGATPYGYRKVDPKVPGVLEVDPVTGPEVAGIVRHLLEGWSLHRIAADLNYRKVPTPGRSKAWTPSSVRKVAVRPGNAGLRVYQGEVIGQAAWPAIVTESEFAQVAVALADPARKTNVGNEHERKHLLSYGLGECGVCTGRLRVARKGKKRVALYVCEGKGCTGRQVERVDDPLRDVVLARLARKDAARVLSIQPVSSAPDPAVDVDELRERQAAAARAYGVGAVTIEQLVALTATINEQITAAEVARPVGRVPADSSQVARLLAVKDMRTLWEKRMTVAQKRSAAEWLFDAVRIMPQRPGPGFDPESVVFDPRGQSSTDTGAA